MKNQMIFLTIAMLFSAQAMASNGQIKEDVEKLREEGYGDAYIDDTMQYQYGLTHTQTEQYINEVENSN